MIDLIRDFIGFYGFGELLNKNAFMNAWKDGKVKYCSVSFDDSDRTFYYKANDEGIKIGDYVSVPFGKANTERREGYMENIEYFRIDGVPFPLEKTKQIIKKV
ncbi:hypothetical protein QS257_01730 [Terrilactibacillus sp. S3-3]|nr:hypothetical protein QS257_01730 [Terrilactibacillus sp. S3-3]